MKTMEKLLQELREYYETGKTKEVTWRKAQLQGLLNFAKEREDDILRALKLDIGKHPVESFRDEVGPLIKDINIALHDLPYWMHGKKVKLPLAAFPTSTVLVPEPLGVVLIISSWNFPIGLSLEPLIGAIAAGNTAVLKPSDLAPATSALFAEALPKYVDSNAIKITEGGADVTGQLLQHKWDKIFFTGSHRVGKIVMTAAAKYLTPVTLELGGKCPMVVDSVPKNSWLKNIALKRMIAGKFGTCSGQACIGVDYILVEKNLSSELVESLKSTIDKMFGSKPEECVARILNKYHFTRLKELLDEPRVKSSVVYGGSVMKEDKLYIEPTILVDPPLDAAIMTEEIFGPLLPIITLDHIEDSIKFISSRPRPLSIYCFTNDDKLRRRLASETSSGSLIFNDTVLQYAADTIPFGGVGESGFGRYHGKFSFDTFSHEKTILKRPMFPDFWFRYPPWDVKKLEIFRAAYVFNYLAVVLIVLGLKKPKPFSKNI
ncbi:hypothetical protein vseg_021709 [Gypsophila vaccaria]